MKLQDLSGKRFGRLTVKAFSHIDNHRCARWVCICDCGNETIPTTNMLKKGDALSCGCLQKEKARELCQNRRKYNNYDLYDDYGICYMKGGWTFIFDREDYEKIKNYCWHYNKQNGYITAHKLGTKKDSVLVHRIIMDLSNDDKRVVDHINHVKCDNRKVNLRIVTKSQNAQNAKWKANPYPGVKELMDGRYFCSITVNKKRITIGTFNTFEEAKEKRMQAENLFFGEYSYNNSISTI